jgi:lycopene cyclase domain-containing protein
LFGQWSYLAMLGFVVVASFWLEFAFKLRVLRDPKRLLKTLALTIPLFVIWDAYAIANQHWFFSAEQTIGIFGPFGIPIEEYLFFIIIPIAGLLTLEGVTNFLPTVKRVLNFLKRERS